MKMLKEVMLHPLLKQMFKMVSLCMDTNEKHCLSLFVNHLIDNCLLYARGDHTHTAAGVLSYV